MMWALVVALLIVCVALVVMAGVVTWALRDQFRQNGRLTRALIARNAQEFDILERSAQRPDIERAKRGGLAAVPSDPRERIAQAVDPSASLPKVPEGFGG